jgi:integrase
MLATAPTLEEEEVEPYAVDEVQQFLRIASEGRNSARWAFALALGLRQGEALGLQWSDIDLEKGEAKIRRSRLRPKYTHGCVVPCGRRPGYCPKKRQTNADTDGTKSRAGRRKIGLPGELIGLLDQHRNEQDKERITAGNLWQEGDWVFASPTGQPLNPNTDFHEWKALLKKAGLREGRLHDARHTAATVLLALKIQERAVMGIMGWSSSKMAARYQHVTDPIRKDIAKRVGGVIWTEKKKSKKGKKRRDGDGRKAA